MKQLDAFSRRFLAVCMGLALLVAASALFFLSVNSVFGQQGADPVRGPYGVQAGQYQVAFSQEFDGERTQYRALLLNTQTAQSRYYYYDYMERAWKLHQMQIPTQPF